MELLKLDNALITTLIKSLDEIDKNWRDYEGLIIPGSWPGEDDKEFIKKAISRVKEAKKNKIPFLGICLGLHVLALSEGGRVVRMDEQRKGIYPVKGWWGETQETHWHGYKIEGEFPGYVVYETDGIIEAMRKDNIIATQFHPEYQSSKKNPHPILKEFLDTCKLKKQYLKEVKGGIVEGEDRRRWFCNWASSLGELEGTAEDTWGTLKYEYKKHKYENLIQFGAYDARDYFTLWRHKGRKAILWAGSDILNLKNNFLLNDGKLKIVSKIFGCFPNFLDRWLSKNAEHWVENTIEQKALADLGIKANVCPSFMGDVSKFQVSYLPEVQPNAYLSSSEGRQIEYGFGVIENIAGWLPNIWFHLYGADWKTRHKNVIIHGRVPKEKMNEDIKRYQIGLRLNEFDGFSEVLAKAVLMGQYAIGKVQHPLIPSYETELDLIDQLNDLSHRVEPNLEAREYYIKHLNKFPWVSKES